MGRIGDGQQLGVRPDAGAAEIAEGHAGDAVEVVFDEQQAAAVGAGQQVVERVGVGAVATAQAGGGGQPYCSLGAQGALG